MLPCKQAHGSINLDNHTSTTKKITCAVSELFDRIVDKNLLIRRMYVVADHVLPEADAPKNTGCKVPWALRGLSRGGNAVTAVTSADQSENVCAFSHGQPVCMKLFCVNFLLQPVSTGPFFKSLWT